MVRVPKTMKEVAHRIFPLGYEIMEAWIDKSEWGNQYTDSKDLRAELSLTNNDTVCDAYIKIKPSGGGPPVSILLETTNSKGKDIDKMVEQLKKTCNIIFAKIEDIDYCVLHGAKNLSPYTAERSEQGNIRVLKLMGREFKLTPTDPKGTTKSIKVYIV